MPSRIRMLLLALVAFALVAGACGSSDGDVAASGDPAEPKTETDDHGADHDADGVFPASVTSAGVETTIEARPEAIVSLSPAATEMLFAIGAGDQVIAADSFSDYPAEAPTTDLSGFDPNLEAVIALDPDLVLLQGDANDLVAGLDAVGVPTIVLPAAAVLDDTYAQIEILGAATGHVGGAAEVVLQMQTDIEEILGRVEPSDEPLTYYHELDDTLFSVTSKTFIGEIYSLAGLENVADAADPDGANGGYPQLSAEYLIDADPDLIFLADTKCCAQDAESLSKRPGFDQLTAVQDGRVIELDDDIASRWGPRVVDFLREIVDATAKVQAG